MNMKRFFYTILMFPVDLMRLTIDVWRFTLERPAYRGEQPCIYCRGCDNSETPRVMSYRIRYWNLWMPRLLHPDLRKKSSSSTLRPLPVCHREGGYLRLPFYIPILALLLAGFWSSLLVMVILETGIVPPEVVERFRPNEAREQWVFRGILAPRL